ncbi:hypothetical protein ABLG96_18715 [Nakamurella sp. A5-74]|uniref:DUF222 domain-containing protein n=1 Tax=Nakamurella sp. A5-74 TaxID=3158264 RepID=A0AAU8DPF9_9ACTN
MSPAPGKDAPDDALVAAVDEVRGLWRTLLQEGPDALTEIRVVVQELLLRGRDDIEITEGLLGLWEIAPSPSRDDVLAAWRRWEKQVALERQYPGILAVLKGRNAVGSHLSTFGYARARSFSGKIAGDLEVPVEVLIGPVDDFPSDAWDSPGTDLPARLTRCPARVSPAGNQPPHESVGEEREAGESGRAQHDGGDRPDSTPAPTTSLTKTISAASTRRRRPPEASGAWGSKS